MTRRSRFACSALVSALALTAAAPAEGLSPALAQKMIAAARAVVDTPYEFGGRLRKKEGIDCLGLVFLAAEKVSSCGWKGYSVNPTELVKGRELGAPVEGLAPVKTAEIAWEKLQPGDVIMLLSPTENPSEAALAELGGQKQWVWHTGLYTGDGKWINADPFGAKVIEGPLAEYLATYAGDYAGIFVTRMAKGPAPKVCRKHRPMR